MDRTILAAIAATADATGAAQPSDVMTCAGVDVNALLGIVQRLTEDGLATVDEETGALSLTPAGRGRLDADSPAPPSDIPPTRPAPTPSALFGTVPAQAPTPVHIGHAPPPQVTPPAVVPASEQLDSAIRGWARKPPKARAGSAPAPEPPTVEPVVGPLDLVPASERPGAGERATPPRAAAKPLAGTARPKRQGR